MHHALIVVVPACVPSIMPSIACDIRIRQASIAHPEPESDDLTITCTCTPLRAPRPIRLHIHTCAKRISRIGVHHGPRRCKRPAARTLCAALCAAPPACTTGRRRSLSPPCCHCRAVRFERPVHIANGQRVRVHCGGRELASATAEPPFVVPLNATLDLTKCIYTQRPGGAAANVSGDPSALYFTIAPRGSFIVRDGNIRVPCPVRYHQPPLFSLRTLYGIR